MGDSFSPNAPLPTTPPLVSLEAFHVCDYFSCSVMSKPFSHGSAKGITWAGFALCVIVFISRISIRVVCFRRFFVEDYLMMLALTILLAITILGQLYVGYIYNFVTVSNGDQLPSPDFLSETSTGLRSFAALTVLNYVGIWLVKLNFLLFSAVLEKMLTSTATFGGLLFVSISPLVPLVLGLSTLNAFCLPPKSSSKNAIVTAALQ